MEKAARPVARRAGTPPGPQRQEPKHRPCATPARESFILGTEAVRQIVFDPLLPDPLVDAGARQRFIDAVVRFDAAGQTIWKRFREENAA